MDIHKPKPWHGVREFLKEYLIIVVGVLTALAGEQGVEWLHWKHVAAETEDHLAAGIAPDLVNAVERVAVFPCIEARYGELATALQRPNPIWTGSVIHAPGYHPNDRVFQLVVASSGRVWPHAAWDSALASGALSHMPRERVDLYGDLYRLAEVGRDQQRAEAEASAPMAPLGFDRPLTVAERTAFLGRLAAVEERSRAINGVSRQMLNSAQQLNLKPPPKELAERMAAERSDRGACVADVKLPLG